MAAVPDALYPQRPGGLPQVLAAKTACSLAAHVRRVGFGNRKARILELLVQEFEALAPKAVERLEAGFEDAMAVMALPEPIRRRLRTTNALERLNREIRRRERVVGIFPNEEAALRLLGAVLMEIDEAWATGHRYLDMAEYLAWMDKPKETEVIQQRNNELEVA